MIDRCVDVAVMCERISTAYGDLGVRFKFGVRGLAAFSLGHCGEFLANLGIYGVCDDNRNPLTYRSDRSVMGW